jgi:hypothetical protein
VDLLGRRLTHVPDLDIRERVHDLDLSVELFALVGAVAADLARMGGRKANRANVPARRRDLVRMASSEKDENPRNGAAEMEMVASLGLQRKQPALLGLQRWGTCPGQPPAAARGKGGDQSASMSISS